MLLAEGVEIVMFKVTAIWSEMVRSVSDRLLMATEGVVETRSDMHPCVWVGEVICSLSLRLFNFSKKSNVRLVVGESMDVKDKIKESR